MAKHDNVYDAMLTGFVKLLLVMCIGALTLSKFAGFEWCAVACFEGVQLPYSTKREMMSVPQGELCPWQHHFVYKPM